MLSPDDGILIVRTLAAEVHCSISSVHCKSVVRDPHRAAPLSSESSRLVRNQWRRMEARRHHEDGDAKEFLAFRHGVARPLGRAVLRRLSPLVDVVRSDHDRDGWNVPEQDAPLSTDGGGQ